MKIIIKLLKLSGVSLLFLSLANASGHGEITANYVTIQLPAKDAGQTQGKLADGAVPLTPGPLLNVEGLPFLKTSIFTPQKEGDGATLALHGVQAETLYLLGCINSVDRANPDWGGGIFSQNYFIGDEAGALTIRYRSGQSDRIPLIFGYTLWWREPYRTASSPFTDSESAMALLDRALCVANGKRTDSQDYFLRIDLRREPIESIHVEDCGTKQGYPLIQGLTLASVKNTRQLDPVQFVPRAGAFLSAPWQDYFKTHTIASADPLPRSRQKAIATLAHSMYTYPSDISWPVLRKTPPDVTENNFSGPKVRFSGPPMAQLMTNIYYENSNYMLGRVDEEGMVHESHEGADYYRGFGGWAPHIAAFYDTSYTRIRALILLANMGFLDRCESSLQFYDHWLMYFPKAYPTLQMDGKPVPGHATVIANKPHIYFDLLRHVGWPTKFKTRDFGNPENDGHGMLMLTHWRVWLKQGRSAQWVNQHWDALNEAAEYIPWCLDYPKLSFSEHGLLYNESEGGMQQASLFCDDLCYLGLLAYADMAQVAGRADKAQRWRQQAARLFKAMLAYYPVQDEQWGDVWNKTKTAAWPYSHTSLSPVIMGMDYYGYDVVHRLPNEIMERTWRTYQRQRTLNQPDWCATAGIGYGQGYITQAALLFDQMEDSAKLIDWMGRVCFSPRQPHPYRVPEGSTLATNALVWRRWGDLGNLYQLAEVVYTIQLMLGIDDLQPAELCVMPRIPQNWTGIDVRDWPVRIQSQGQSVMTHLAYTLVRSKGNRRLKMRLKLDRPVDHIRLRLGPFPMAVNSIQCKVNGHSRPARLEQIGDAKWSWIHLDDGMQTDVIEMHCR